MQKHQDAVAVAGGVVINPQGQILIVSQRGNSWSLPKGHVDAGETKLAAARREIYEESGVKELTFIKELGSYCRYKIAKDPRFEDLSELKEITLFLFKTETMELCPQDSYNPEARWVTKEEVISYLTHQEDKRFFESILPML